MITRPKVNHVTAAAISAAGQARIAGFVCWKNEKPVPAKNKTISIKPIHGVQANTCATAMNGTYIMIMKRYGAICPPSVTKGDDSL